MTLDEIEKLWETRKSAMDVWHDRMHEMPMHLLVDLILEHIPHDKALTILADIQKDINESIEEETNGLESTTQ